MILDECCDCGKTYERYHVWSPMGPVRMQICEDCDYDRACNAEPDYDAPSAEELRLEAIDIQRRLKQ
jgi:hypothetical protein